VLVGAYVYQVAALLARWRCRQCRTTFTDCRSFAAPYEAYTTPQVAVCAIRYVANESRSYRTEVRSVNLPIFYASGSTGKLAKDSDADETPSLTTTAHTTLFRWMAALARGVPASLDQPHGGSDPASCKFTSERWRILIACRATWSIFSSGNPADARTY